MIKISDVLYVFVDLNTSIQRLSSVAQINLAITPRAQVQALPLPEGATGGGQYTSNMVHDSAWYIYVLTTDKGVIVRLTYQNSVFLVDTSLHLYLPDDVASS